MKIKHFAFLFFLLFMLGIYRVKSQTIAYKGIYLDSFDGIVGNTIKEDSLLQYLKDSSFNSIICYRISNVISSTLSSTKNTTLANFLKRARTQFGIKNVLASSESYTTFATLVAPYNRSRTDSAERFNYFYLEFEFWNVHSTSPVSSSNNGYYCTNYLSPKGYNCDTAGAFKYYKKMLKSLDSLANKDGIRSATYVGNPNQGQCKFIANTVDLLLCDNYTSNISNIYVNVKTRFSYFGSTSKTLQIVPIFASYSPGGTFLGDWLTKAPIGPHSEKSVFNNYFLPRYNSESGSWKSKLNLIGYQWYRYSGMPHNGNYSTSTFCNPPTNLASSSITTTSANLTWTGISSGLGYVVQYRAIGSSAWSNPIASSGVSLQITALSAGTNYEFQVKSSCISSSSAFSASAIFQTLSAFNCSLASGLTATTITDVSAALSWAAVSGATSYAVKYRKVGVASWVTTSSSSISKSITNLSASSIYEFQVQTICLNGSSNFTASYLFSTLAPICFSPTGLTSSLITSNSATIKWTAIAGVLGYNIHYRIAGTSAWLSTNSTTNSKSILALSESASYEVQVQTKCSATNFSSYSSSFIFTTLSNSCDAPTNITSNAATTSSFTVYWLRSASASSYKVQYRKTTSSSWTTLTTTKSYKNISSLSTGTAYEFQVASVCVNGTSNYSNISVVSTLSNLSSCASPTGLFTTNITLTAVTLNWSTVNGASSYKLQYRIIGTTSWTSKTTSFTNKNITNLSANENYEFQVQTICANGTSSFSTSSFFSTNSVSLSSRISAMPASSTLKLDSSSIVLPVLSENTNSESFKIFPNPTNRENINLRIQLKQKDKVKIQLIDMLGNTLYSEKIITDEYGFAEIKILTTVDLKIGIYQVLGYTSNQKLNCKLILK